MTVAIYLALLALIDLYQPTPLWRNVAILSALVVVRVQALHEAGRWP